MDRKFLVVVIVFGLALVTAGLGARFDGGDWLAEITTPDWTPGALVFAEGWVAWYAAWCALAIIVAHGAVRLEPAPVAVWLAGLGTVLAWNWMMFGLHRPGWALGVMTLAVAIGALALLRGGRAHRHAVIPAFVSVAWLAVIWCWNIAIWRAGGGGLDSIVG